MIRFIVDSCVAKSVVEHLRKKRFDVVWVAERESDPGDLEIIREANRQKRVIITIDKDFAEFYFLKGEKLDSIIRIPDARPEKQVRIISYLLDNYKNDIAKGAIITVKQDKVRIKRLTQK